MNQLSLCNKVVRRRRRAGFSLIEVTLAVAVAAVALMGLLAMAMMGMRTGRQAVDDTVIATLAQDIFAEARGMRATDLPPAGFPRVFDREGRVSGDPAYAGDYYRCDIQVTDAYPTGIVKDVRLEFAWPIVASGGAPNTNFYYAKFTLWEQP